jgi:hypothetical protein
VTTLRQSWSDAIARGLAEPVGLGDAVELPAVAWTEFHFIGAADGSLDDLDPTLAELDSLPTPEPPQPQEVSPSGSAAAPRPVLPKLPPRPPPRPSQPWTGGPLPGHDFQLKLAEVAAQRYVDGFTPARRLTEQERREALLRVARIRTSLSAIEQLVIETGDRSSE